MTFRVAPGGVNVSGRGNVGEGAGGRRRADGTSSTSPRDEIIRAATRLFAEQGYAKTTMKSIAEAVGLRQPSVYYWFRNKEELLHATASINRFSAAVVAALRKSGAGPSQKLYRLLYEDTKHICLLGPLDYHQVESVAYQRPEEFSEFWTDYRTLFDGIVELIDAAMVSSEFRHSDPQLSGAAALSLNEGLQKLYRYRAGPSGGLGLPVPVPLGNAETVAHQSATTTLSSLLAAATALESVRAEAMAIDLQLDLQDPVSD
jgi:AcrR family transcriptional regulator